MSAITPAAYTVQCPAYFALAKKDYICLPEVQMAAGETYCPRLTAKTYDGDHWLQFSHAEELNADLLQWVENTISIAPQM
jgi:surfactin synthase thioesterase subunit